MQISITIQCSVLVCNPSEQHTRDRKAGVFGFYAVITVDWKLKGMDFHRGLQFRQSGDGVYSIRRKISRQIATSPDANSGFGHKEERMGCCSENIESTCFSGPSIEESPFALSTLQSMEWKTAGRSTKMLVEGEKLTTRKVHKNLPSVVEKLMGFEKLHPQHVFQKQKMLLTGSNGTLETDLSLLQPQNSSSRKHAYEMNWLVPRKQAKRHFTDLMPFHGCALKDIKNSAKKSTHRISNEDCVYSLERRSYQAIHWPSNQFNDSNNSYRPLLSSSAEIIKSITRNEFPKRLKMTSQHKEFGQKILSSHEEMFASSCRGIRSRDFGSSVVLTIMNEKSLRVKKPALHVLSSAISKEDGLKNMKFVNLPSSTYTLFSSTASRGVAQSYRQEVNDVRHYSIKDILNLRGRNLMKTTEKIYLKSDKKSGKYHKETSSDDTIMNCAKTSMDGKEVEPQSLESCKSNRHMSPVSVDEVQLKEESADAGISEDDFMGIEERDYSYLLDMLIISGIHAVSQERLYNEGWILKFPVEKVVFEKLEKKYCNLVSWSSSERRLFFDRINSTLGEVLAPCMDSHPWVRYNKRLAPMWGSEGLLEKVWEILIREHKTLGVGKAEDKVLDRIWLDLGNVENEIGMKIEQKLLEELLEEFVSEMI